MDNLLLKCQTMQVTEQGGTVRLIDPAQSQGNPLQSQTVMIVNFPDPAKAAEFKPGKVYIIAIAEQQ